MQTVAHARADEEEGRGELTRLVTRYVDLAAVERAADRERQHFGIDLRAERSQCGHERRDRTRAQARRPVEVDLPRSECRDSRAEAGDRTGVLCVDDRVVRGVRVARASDG